MAPPSFVRLGGQPWGLAAGSFETGRMELLAAAGAPQLLQVKPSQGYLKSQPYSEP